MSLRRETVRVGPGEPQRVDRYIADTWSVLSRSQLKARAALISVNGSLVKPSRLIKEGDRIELAWEESEAPNLKPENIPLEIVFENERVLVVNKAQGMVSHPANGNWDGTLMNAVLGYLGSTQSDVFSPPMPGLPGQDSNPSGRAPSPAALRPGLVHRLDKDTSGIIILAKDPDALEFLCAQFRERQTKKQYLAIVRGRLSKPEGQIENFLMRDPRERKRFTVSPSEGKHALTLYRQIRGFSGYSFMSLFPRTGRTHQLRVHMRELGCPILGDPIYGKPDPSFPRASLMLHAYRLKIRLPGEAEPRIFRADLPERFQAILLRLEKSFNN